MTEPELLPVRERSPRFPFISLKRALERAQELYDEHNRHPVRVESAGSAWGYGAKSSGWRQTVSALLLYGILVDSGSGADRKVQLTEHAWKYLVDERQEERDKLLKLFALSPKIMRELFEAWGHPPPGDAECRSQLRVERDFTEGAAAELLDIYKENVAFAKLHSSDSLPPNPKTDKGSGGAMEPAIDPGAGKGPPPFNFSNPPLQQAAIREIFPLPEGEVTLIIPASLSLESAEELEDRLAVIVKGVKRRARKPTDTGN